MITSKFAQCGRPCLVLAIAALLALATGCTELAEADPGEVSEIAGERSAEATPTRRSDVHRGTFQKTLLLTGALEAERSIEIKAPQTQIFQMRIQYMAEEGSTVKAGDPLIDFDNSAFADQVEDLENRILDAETQIVAKRSELASELKDLEIELAERIYQFETTSLDASIEPEVVARRDYEERQFQKTKAEKELAETRERIELTRSRGQAELDVLLINKQKLEKDLLKAREGLSLLSIAAPSDGLVVYETRPQTTIRFQEGDSCWPGQQVMRLPDLSAMRVEFQVSEVDVPLLRVGMPVAVQLDAFPDRVLSGRIEEIPTMAVKRGDLSLFEVVASLDQSSSEELKPGMSVVGRVTIESVEDAWLAPRDLVRSEGGSFWLREGEGEEAKERRVEVLDRNEHYYRLGEEQG